MGTIRLVLRTETIDNDGSSPIRLIYSIHGKRQYYSTGLKAWRGVWNDVKKRWEGNFDTKEQRVLYLNKVAAKKLLPDINFELLPSYKEVEEINAKLTALRKEVANIEKRFELDNIPYSKEMVITELERKRTGVTKREGAPQELYSFIDQYILKHQGTRKKGSLSVYKSLKRHMQDFQKQSSRPITFENLDHNFFTDFKKFLLTPREILVESKSKVPGIPARKKFVSLNNTTTAKILSTIKTFVGYARKSGAIVNDKYKDFKIQREKGKVIALTSEEFESLYFMDLSGNKRLAQVRDVFCFSCVTGLRYSDLAQLRRVHIVDHEIRLNVQKTSTDLSIPLNNYSLEILDKYKEMHKPLPIITNAKMNLYLKELCKEAGIDQPVEIIRLMGDVRESTVYPKYELISVHTGRKTFVTLSLEKGMSAQEVMSISGHEDYKSFQRYVDVTESRKKIVMAKAWGMKSLAV